MSFTKPRIKYLLFANTLKSKVLGEYPFNVDKKTTENASKILEKVIRTKYDKYDERNSIAVKDGIYFYILTNDKIFFFSKFI